MVTCGLLLGSGSFDFDFFQSSGGEVGRVGRRREREESGDGEASDLDYPGCRIENLIRFHSKPQIGFQHPKSARKLVFDTSHKWASPKCTL